MRSSRRSRFVSFFMVLVGLVTPAMANMTFDEAAKMLPNKVGDARALRAPISPTAGIFELNKLSEIGAVSTAMRSYVSASGDTFGVQLIKMRSDSAAYAFVMSEKRKKGLGVKGQASTLNLGGTAAFASYSQIYLAKGATVVIFTGLEEQANNDANLLRFARSFAETLEAGAGEIPVLVKHLPDWETTRERAVYVLTQSALKEVMPNQPVLDAVSFDGGTEAVTATYNQGARLVIVEYATPQFAFDADTVITARIAGLRSEGKPVPSAYRRVGNYAVFVFDAPDEGAAMGLIDRVKYEKDVRWLGEDPFAIERHNRGWLNMSTSVIVNTVKATGLAIAVCLGIGGILGGWVFMRRRAQSALTENFSDAGGMMRLNLDGMNVESNASRLLGHEDNVQ